MNIVETSSIIFKMKEYKNIVILTGAGISQESGIKTFRDHNGLWENHRLEDVASLDGFRRNPQLVYDFYNQRRKQLLQDEIKPNQAHYNLAQIEKEHQGTFSLITQNVDNLHERAGSQNLIHMHGELLKMRCQKTGKIFDILSDLNQETICSCCNHKGNLRPHIVWFGEEPFMMNQIFLELEYCDLFISIGTSGTVYPAAMFVQVAKKANAHTIEINPYPTEKSSIFDTQIRLPATLGTQKLLESLKSL